VFKKKGIEVLLMTDRVDEWALNYLHDFDGTPMQSVAKGAVDLGKLQDEAEKKAAEEAAETFKPLLAKLKEALKDKAEDVRVTTRLVDSPACLVVQDAGMSMQLARMLKQAGQPRPRSSRCWKSTPSTRWSRSSTAACTSTTWRTSCSTRRCWPKAACRTTRPPTSSA
jgi:molecular chaperone HtpG